MKIKVFNIKFEPDSSRSADVVKDSIILEVPEISDITSYINIWFEDIFTVVPTFDWEFINDDEDDNTLDSKYPSADRKLQN